ncbi:MAG: efflux RND transporter periplasmic adaptor subunit [Hyphomicrobiales bacterium]
MAFPIRFSHVAAIGLTAGVAFYMLGGTTMLSGQGPIDPDAPVRATDTASGDPELFAVRARVFEAQERANALVMRGRTEADASIVVSAETGGRIVEMAVREGDAVAQGDILCRLDEAARQATVTQASAGVAQAQIDLSAAQQLADNGFGAENRVLALQAAFDGAQASLEQAELDLTRTIVRAPVDALVQLPIAVEGAQLSPGGLCATLLDTDPLVVTGQVSERQIASIAVGMDAQAELVTGETVTGRVAFISTTADDATRTFRVDVEVPNADGDLRVGVTAQASIGLPSTTGHLLPLSTLKLDDGGIVGVSLIDEEDRVFFQPVTLLGDEREGVWVAGLPQSATVVVVGQDYVAPGQQVSVTMVEDGILQTSQADTSATSQTGAAQ